MAGVTFHSSSPAATRKLAGELVRKIVRSTKDRKSAAVIALNGELGAGKTVFAKGLARGLGIRRPISSPTFIIFRNYPVREKGSFENFVHMDAYRLKSAAELKILNFPELLKNPKNLILIEWADNVKKIIPRNAIRINLRAGQKEKERILKIKTS